MIAAASPYETWVRTLRAWQTDCTVPLDDLPVLTVADLPPAAWDRFVTHLAGCLRASMDQWEQSFVTSLRRETDEFRRANVMVDARRALARRLLLGRHPGLPEPLRQAAWDSIARDIRSLQDQLEQMARQGSGTLDPRRVNRDVAFYTAQSLTVLLTPGFPLEEFASGRYAPAAPPAPAPATAPVTQSSAVLPPGLGSSRPRTIRPLS